VSKLRQSPSGASLPSYTATFAPQTINADSSVGTTVPAPGVVMGQNIVANFAPLPTASLVVQAAVQSPDNISVYLTNVSPAGVTLASSVNVSVTPI
jgi:hypothetical protein